VKSRGNILVDEQSSSDEGQYYGQEYNLRPSNEEMSEPNEQYDDVEDKI
jgi:hypothetical protein